MIELIDTHCHIQSIGATGGEAVTTKQWGKLEDTNISRVVAEAKEAGVGKLISVGCDHSDSHLAIKLASEYPNVWASIGIHPHEAKDYVNNNEIKMSFASLVSRPKVVAIGECGLDYFYEHSNPDDQRQVLEFQLNLASKHNLPIIFHVREAFNDFWPILDNFNGIKGVLHSFTDSQANLKKAIDRGLFVGVNGIATFTKDSSQIDMYKSIPLNNLLLETDSPFLSPVPHRGQVNTPKNVRLVAEYLANLRGQSLEDIASQTTLNALSLFGL
jgi:TatD DNase family protein